MISRLPEELADCTPGHGTSVLIEIFQKISLSLSPPNISPAIWQKIIVFKFILSIFLFLVMFSSKTISQPLSLADLLSRNLSECQRNFYLRSDCSDIDKVLTRFELHMFPPTLSPTGSLKGARPYLTYLWQYKILYPTQWHHELTKLWV